MGERLGTLDRRDALILGVLTTGTASTLAATVALGKFGNGALPYQFTQQGEIVTVCEEKIVEKPTIPDPKRAQQLRAEITAFEENNRNVVTPKTVKELLSYAERMYPLVFGRNPLSYNETHKTSSEINGAITGGITAPDFLLRFYNCYPNLLAVTNDSKRKDTPYNELSLIGALAWREYMKTQTYQISLPSDTYLQFGNVHFAPRNKVGLKWTIGNASPPDEVGQVLEDLHAEWFATEMRHGPDATLHPNYREMAVNPAFQYQYRPQIFLGGKYIRDFYDACRINISTVEEMHFRAQGFELLTGIDAIYASHGVEQSGELSSAILLALDRKSEVEGSLGRIPILTDKINKARQNAQK